MNAHSSFSTAAAATTAATALRIVPKGMPEVKKMQDRDRVIEAIPNVLISAFGVSTLTARVIAPMLYDSFAAAYGVPPANVEFIRSALKLPKGREALDAMIERYGLVKVPEVTILDATPPAVADNKPTCNEKLTAKAEAELHDRLMTALKSGSISKIDRVVKGIHDFCKAAGQTYFVTQFSNWTDVSRLIMSRKTELNLSFGFYWTEGGPGNEVLPQPEPKVVPAEKLVPDEELKRLTKLLRQAVRKDTIEDLDVALTEIATVCRSFGVRSFKTPYREIKGRSVFGTIAWRCSEMKLGFWFESDPDGLYGEEALSSKPVTEAPKKAKPSRAEIEARKAANRAERLKLQPAKGGTGTKGK